MIWSSTKADTVNIKIQYNAYHLNVIHRCFILLNINKNKKTPIKIADLCRSVARLLFHRGSVCPNYPRVRSNSGSLAASLPDLGQIGLWSFFNLNVKYPHPGLQYIIKNVFGFPRQLPVHAPRLAPLAMVLVWQCAVNHHAILLLRKDLDNGSSRMAACGELSNLFPRESLVEQGRTPPSNSECSRNL